MYPLEFEDDAGDIVNIMCQVYSVPKYNTAELGSMNMSGTFELYAPDPVYRGTEELEATGGYGFIGGTQLGTQLGTPLNHKIGEVVINNEGNWASPLRVDIVGEIVNPKMQNLTANTFYGVVRTTNNLVIN
jgi:hypothetical protein